MIFRRNTCIFQIIIVSLRLRLEDRLHLGTKGRCSRSEVKQIKINRDLFCISLDLHYLCTQKHINNNDYDSNRTT